MILRGRYTTQVAALYAGGGASLPTPAIYYPLSDTSDTGAGGLTLTNTGSVTFVAGKVGNAASISLGKTLSRATNTSFEPAASGSWSIVFWLKWASTYSTTVKKGNLINTGWHAQMSSAKGGDTLDLTFYGSASKLVSGTVTAATWQFWCVVVDRPNNLLRLYRNGTQVASTSISGWTYTTSGDAFTIGVWPTFLFDEVGFFDAVLGQADIDGIYNSGTGKTYSGGAWS